MYKNILLTVLFFLSFILLTSSQARAATLEIGQNKKIVSSTQFFPATNANDGNVSTYWEARSHTWPQTLTIDLGGMYAVNMVNMLLPLSWEPRNQTVAILGSIDNKTYKTLVPSTSYPFSRVGVSVPFTTTPLQYIRLSISKNSVAPAAQMAEVQVFGTPTSLTSTPTQVTPKPTTSVAPTLTPTPVIPTNTPVIVPTSTPQPTSTPTPSITQTWEIQSVDVMKYTKDVVCNPPSDAFILSEVSKIKELGANYIAISTPYDNPSCGDSLALTKRWIDAARAQGLSIWHRHMGLSFEGIYGVAKTKDANYLTLITNYIKNNPTLFKDGDIFTPTPEPDTAGIYGVTYCNSTCAFDNREDFNTWIRSAQSQVKQAFVTIGVPTIKVGYYGTSGFIVFGENNPDWYGKSFLDQSTVEAMDNVIAMDSYPETYGGTMSNALDGAHRLWPNAKIVLGEWGTITATSDTNAVSQIQASMSSAKRPYVTGFNYWNLGPSGNEGLLNDDLTDRPSYSAVQSFY